jgi:hypothetical protein
MRAILPTFVLLSFAFQTPFARAWGNEGHRMINRAAASSLPADVPAFLRADAASNEIEYLGPEPDRWRSSAEPELNSAQSPEHEINMEQADSLGPLPHKRFAYEAKAYAAGHSAEDIGLLPWQAVEVWERLKAAMRQYRYMVANHQDTAGVESVIVFYAGWLGHYVGDGSQPLHTTIQYNGWTGPNPDGYTTSHQIHHQFESLFVSANIHEADVAAKMTPVKAIDGDMFDAFMAYLRQSQAQVEKIYQLEKAGGFVGAGSDESRVFTTARLAAGASMLRDMIYSAWLDSAKPVPDAYAGK